MNARADLYVEALDERRLAALGALRDAAALARRATRDALWRHSHRHNAPDAERESATEAATHLTGKLNDAQALRLASIDASEELLSANIGGWPIEAARAMHGACDLLIGPQAWTETIVRRCTERLIIAEAMLRDGHLDLLIRRASGARTERTTCGPDTLAQALRALGAGERWVTNTTGAPTPLISEHYTARQAATKE